MMVRMRREGTIDRKTACTDHDNRLDYCSTFSLELGVESSGHWDGLLSIISGFLAQESWHSTGHVLVAIVRARENSNLTIISTMISRSSIHYSSICFSLLNNYSKAICILVHIVYELVKIHLEISTVPSYLLRVGRRSRTLT